MIEKLTD